MPEIVKSEKQLKTGTTVPVWLFKGATGQEVATLTYHGWRCPEEDGLTDWWTANVHVARRTARQLNVPI